LIFNFLPLKVGDITGYLESLAPASFQESYDNAGLITGRKNQVIDSALIALDVTGEVIDEAITKGCGLIISHHPVLFKPLKRLTGDNWVERCLIKAVKNDIAIFSSHTNLDNVSIGVNAKIAEKIGLKNTSILAPAGDSLIKLVTFIPVANLEEVQEAIFSAGAGHIGKYDQCSYQLSGNGTFRAGEGTTPFVGEQGEFHVEKEIRFETILPAHLKNRVIDALINSHPYEEVAYDLYPLRNVMPGVGSGMYGELEFPQEESFFLSRLMDLFDCRLIRHTRLLGKPVKKVAICGGAGSFLLSKAIAVKADVFITGDFKYHDFFDAEDKIVIADIGHYESEQFTKDLFYELLIKKFPNFALRLSEIKTNPISYLIKG
jgi:dinuclear metal center YbgI/SA1388 family protein